MSAVRQVCRVIESSPLNRKILVELNGKLIKTEKLLGLDFRSGDYACFQTYVGSERSLVVALNPNELEDFKANGQVKIEESVPLDFMATLNEIIPPDEDIVIEKFFGFKSSDFSISLNKDLIKDPFIIDRIKTIFEGVATEEEMDNSLRDIFPVIAVQTNEEFQALKDKVFKKADEMLCRKMVNAQTNREVHKFLMNRIDNIDSEKEHIEFFKSLGYYLERLKKIQKENSFSSSKMGVIFYPIYSHYNKKFNRETFDNWIQLKVKRAQQKQES